MIENGVEESLSPLRMVSSCSTGKVRTYYPAEEGKLYCQFETLTVEPASEPMLFDRLPPFVPAARREVRWGVPLEKAA